MTQTVQRDVISVLSQEHHEIEELFVRLEELAGTRDAPDSAAERAEARTVAHEVITELARHWAAEERHLYPAIREYAPDCEELADQELAEHGKAERNAKALERLDPDDEEFWIRVEVLIAVVRGHVEAEETQVFPRLRSAVPAQVLTELGRRVERTELIAPTRPHPATPDRPPGNRLLDPATALVDRLRDTVSSRARGE
jgi:hemerythrin-like domain-containing protein